MSGSTTLITYSFSCLMRSPSMPTTGDPSTSKPSICEGWKLSSHRSSSTDALSAFAVKACSTLPVVATQVGVASILDGSIPPLTPPLSTRSLRVGNATFNKPRRCQLDSTASIGPESGSARARAMSLTAPACDTIYARRLQQSPPGRTSLVSSSLTSGKSSGRT